MRPMAALACVFALVVLFALVQSGPALAGRVKEFHFWSEALKGDQMAEVYLPDGDAPEQGWPVLYLLHGLDGGAKDWLSQGQIAATLDKLIAEKRIKPIIVVMPCGKNSWYVNSADVGGPGDFETALAAELPAAIEAAFPVGRGRPSRAVAGLSMGGYGALRFALAQPERYAAAAALSPAIWQNVPDSIIARMPRKGEFAQPSSYSYFRETDPATVTVDVDLPPAGDHFRGAFGTPFDPHRFNDANVFTLLKRAVDARKTLPALYVTVGDDDSHLLWRGAFAFFETMQKLHQEVEFRVTDGDHSWDVWRRSIVDALVFVDGKVGIARTH